MILSTERLQSICVVQGLADKDLKRRIKPKKSDEEEYELSRYKPLLRTVIEVREFLCLFVSPRRSPRGERTHTLCRTKSQAGSTRLDFRTSKTTPKLRQPRWPGQRPHRQPRCGVPSPAGTALRARATQSQKRASGCSCSSRAG